MSVFLGTFQPEYSPNTGFLREINLKDASNNEIKTAVQSRLPKDINYSLHCDSNKDLSFPYSEGTMSLKGKEIVLYCNRPKKFLLLIPAFFSGISSPPDEEKRSDCCAALIKQAFISTPHDSSEEATKEQREVIEEIRKARKQALTIRFQISNSREFFDMKLGNTSIVKKAYLKGLAIQMGVAHGLAKKKVDISKIFPKAEYLAALAKELNHLQAMLRKELTIEKEEIYKNRLYVCENKFSQQMHLIATELEKEEELIRLKDTENNLTRTEFIRKQLQLVHESVVLLLDQDVKYLTTLSEELNHLQGMLEKELTIGRERVYKDRLYTCENKFSQQMYLVVADLGKEKELGRLRDTANNLTRTEFIEKQLKLVRESVDSLLVQDTESTESIPLVGEHRHASENTQACSTTQLHLVSENPDSPQSSPKAVSHLEERRRFFEARQKQNYQTDSAFPSSEDEGQISPSQQPSPVNSRPRAEGFCQKSLVKPNFSLDTLLSDLEEPSFVKPANKKFRPLPTPPTDR